MCPPPPNCIKDHIKRFKEEYPDIELKNIAPKSTFGKWCDSKTGKLLHIFPWFYEGEPTIDVLYHEEKRIDHWKMKNMRSKVNNFSPNSAEEEFKTGDIVLCDKNEKIGIVCGTRKYSSGSVHVSVQHYTHESYQDIYLKEEIRLHKDPRLEELRRKILQYIKDEIAEDAMIEELRFSIICLEAFLKKRRKKEEENFLNDY